MTYHIPGSEIQEAQSALSDRLLAVSQRFNQDYDGAPIDLPEEVQGLALFEDWKTKKLQGKIASPFWELSTPKKRDVCLDLGCGFSFLIYPWRDWDAVFYGQDISKTARDFVMSRGSQLNSKLFKGVRLKPAHHLEYDPGFFDRVFATGFSCYYPLDYWESVLAAVKKVLKPGSSFVFDVLDPDQALAEDWAILETYLGVDVCLEPLAQWEKLIKASGAKLLKQRSGTLFHLYQVRW